MRTTSPFLFLALALSACANGPLFQPHDSDASAAPPDDASAPATTDDAGSSSRDEDAGGTTETSPVPDMSHWPSVVDLPPSMQHPPRDSQGNDASNATDATNTNAVDASDDDAAAVTNAVDASDDDAAVATSAADATDVDAGEETLPDAFVSDPDASVPADAPDAAITPPVDDPVTDAIRAQAHPVTGADNDFDPVLDVIGDAHYVLIGEESHGTHEFYATRDALTRRLITERGLRAIGVEGNWPDLARVDAFVRGEPGDDSAEQALGDVHNFPIWMWRNRDVVRFLTWLRAYNATLPAGALKVGFYGLDLQALPASLDAVEHYLDSVDPDAAARARARYGCIQNIPGSEWGYYDAVRNGTSPSCETEVADEYAELSAARARYDLGDAVSREAYFRAMGSARVAVDGENYYRQGGSWNLRDEHMDRAVGELQDHLREQSPDGEPARIALWVHNTHAGDERGTDGADYGVENVAMLIGQRVGRDAVDIGMLTYDGAVTSAPGWGWDFGYVTIAPPDPDSVETLLHRAGIPRFVLALRDNDALSALGAHHLERGIGVVYNTQYDAYHYFGVRLVPQFDAVIHFDRTTAVEPLDPTPQWTAGVPGNTVLPAN